MDCKVELIITEKDKENIKKVIEYAINNPDNLDTFKSNDYVSPGDKPDFCCHIDKYRCVFSFEKLTKGWFRHISASTWKHGVIDKNGPPPPFIMRNLAVEFGFDKKGEVEMWLGPAGSPFIVDLISYIDNREQKLIDELEKSLKSILCGVDRNAVENLIKELDEKKK